MIVVTITDEDMSRCDEIARIFDVIQRDRATAELLRIFHDIQIGNAKQQDVGIKENRRALDDLRQAILMLPTKATRAFNDALKAVIPSPGIVYGDTGRPAEPITAVFAAVGAAHRSIPEKRRGPRGLGDGTRAALRELVALHNKLAGSKWPYKDADGTWRRLEGVEFAAAALHKWGVIQSSSTTEHLARILGTRTRANLGA